MKMVKLLHMRMVNIYLCSDLIISYCILVKDEKLIITQNLIFFFIRKTKNIDLNTIKVIYCIDKQKQCNYFFLLKTVKLTTTISQVIDRLI